MTKKTSNQKIVCCCKNTSFHKEIASSSLTLRCLVSTNGHTQIKRDLFGVKSIPLQYKKALIIKTDIPEVQSLF